MLSESELEYPNYSAKVRALIKLTRPPNSITAGVAVTTALFLAISNKSEAFAPLTYIFIAMTAFFVTAHAMVQNDIVDFEADKISSPFRPLPSSIISMQTAKVWALFLFFAAIISGGIVDYLLNLSFPLSMMWAFLNILILDAYNMRFKKSGLLGNMIVAYVVWALFIYADILINQRLTLRVEAIGLYAFFMNWGREVIKGIRDVDGDIKQNVNTIAVRFGEKGAAIVGAILLVIAVLWTIPLIIYPVGDLLISYIFVVFDVIIIYRCTNLLRSPTPSYAQSTKRLFLYLMLLAVIVLLLNQIKLIYF